MTSSSHTTASGNVMTSESCSEEDNSAENPDKLALVRIESILIKPEPVTGEVEMTIAEKLAGIKRKRSLPGTPAPDAEVVALSPRTLMATHKFVCEVCARGFQREQNLQLHKRGHNLPGTLKPRAGKDKDARKKAYVCPETTCVHHDPTRALGDLTGIKKHFSRKHGEKKWQCEKCSKKYAVLSDWKAHSKTCGSRDYKCNCGSVFFRRDTFVTHKGLCVELAADGHGLPTSAHSLKTAELALPAGELVLESPMLALPAGELFVESEKPALQAADFIAEIKPAMPAADFVVKSEKLAMPAAEMVVERAKLALPAADLVAKSEKLALPVEDLVVGRAKPALPAAHFIAERKPAIPAADLVVESAKLALPAADLVVKSKKLSLPSESAKLSLPAADLVAENAKLAVLAANESS